jgi:membrane-bound inhibitor of C-type lysozyme
MLIPISDPKSKINEMILSCEPKKIEVKHVNKEDLSIFQYTIIGSGLEYVLK